MTTENFRFFDPGPLRDDDLELVLTQKVPANPARGHVPAYRFEMRRAGDPRKAGAMELRIGNVDSLVLYGGHIGYGVEPEFRGSHFAARSCRLLFPLAKRHGINPLWITCNPDNWASRRTCELAGGRLVEIVDLPPDNDQYARGDRQKCRYRFDL